MSKLVTQHRAIEAQIKQLQTELAAIESHPEYENEKEFAVFLEDLMNEHGKTLSDIVEILEPGFFSVAKESKSTRGPVPGTPRKRLKYKNPHTGECVETAGGNNRVLKEWKKQYPSQNLKEWIVGDE